MTKSETITKLSEYGIVEAFSDSNALVCLIKGKNLENAKTLLSVTKIVQTYAGEKFPYIETMVNKKDFILIVLRPKTP